MNYVMVEWHDLKPVALHFVHLPDVSEDGFYRAGVSVSAFQRFEHTRFYVANQAGKASLPRRFHVMMEMDYEMNLRSDERVSAAIGESFSTYRNATTHHHASIWEFYKAIGYDYKTKKYA